MAHLLALFASPRRWGTRSSTYGQDIGRQSKFDIDVGEGYLLGFTGMSERIGHQQPGTRISFSSIVLYFIPAM